MAGLSSMLTKQKKKKKEITAVKYNGLAFGGHNNKNNI